MSRTSPPKVRPDWRRAGCTSARGCPGGTWCGQPRPISRLGHAGTRALSALGLALSPLVSPWPRHRRVHSSGSSANWSRHTSPSEMRISDAARASGCSARPRLRPSRLSRCERAGREIAASTSRRVWGLCTGGTSNVYLLCTCGNYMQYAGGVFRICSPKLRRLWVAMLARQVAWPTAFRNFSHIPSVCKMHVPCSNEENARVKPPDARSPHNISMLR